MGTQSTWGIAFVSMAKFLELFTRAGRQNGDASALQIGGAAVITFGLCYLQHQSVLQSGLQPNTMSGEWQAAGMKERLHKRLESCPGPDGKKFLQDPIRMTRVNVESGRAELWAATKDNKEVAARWA